MAAGPDFARYQSIIRSAGFCRTGTGVWRMTYNAVETCRNFLIHPYFWTFVIINNTIIISHVELHNKIMFTV